MRDTSDGSIDGEIEWGNPWKTETSQCEQDHPEGGITSTRGEAAGAKLDSSGNEGGSQSKEISPVCWVSTA